MTRRGRGRGAVPSRRSDRAWGTHWRSDGRPKTAYTQAVAAERVREMTLADIDAGLDGSSPAAYECDHCGRWHVGNGGSGPGRD